MAKHEGQLGTLHFSGYLVLDTYMEIPESLPWSLYCNFAIIWASWFHRSKTAVGFSMFSWKHLQACKRNPWNSLNQLCLWSSLYTKGEQPQEWEKCSVFWSSVAIKHWTGGHCGQGTTLERASWLPAPAAERREPKRKSCPTGSSDCGANDRKCWWNDGDECLLLSLSKWMRGWRGGIDYPSPPRVDWARTCLGPHSTLEMSLSFARGEAEPKRLQLWGKLRSRRK